MAVEYFNESIDFPDIARVKVEQWIKEVIDIETYTLGDVSIIFCSDSYLLKINQDFLSHNYFTDIITFDYSENNTISGDLFISLDTVQSNSKIFKTGFKIELYRVIIHGILHLLNYNDKSDEEIKLMRHKEDQYLHLLSSYL